MSIIIYFIVGLLGALFALLSISGLDQHNHDWSPLFVGFLHFLKAHNPLIQSIKIYPLRLFWHQDSHYF